MRRKGTLGLVALTAILLALFVMATPALAADLRSADSIIIASGDVVKVSSRRGEVQAKALVGDRTEPGVVFMPWHFAEAAANKLTIAALDPIGKIPEYKVCAVKVEAA